MKKVYHPYKNFKIDPIEYIREFGNNKLNDEELARCPICNQRMTLVSPSSPNAHIHFRHKPKSGYCPSKSQNTAAYLGLYPLHPDEFTAQKIKDSFKKNWQKHYVKLNFLVKGLSVSEFINVLKISNREHIWEYSKLEEFYLPYIFATRTDFSPKSSYRMKDGSFFRKKYFRCWFDPSVKRYDDLWITRDTPLLFWRAWYELPEGKTKPSLQDLIDSYPSEIEKDFLDREIKLQDWIVDKVNTWIFTHL